jgi:hypothetical protein
MRMEPRNDDVSDDGTPDDTPPGCCCEFVDRNGRLAHLADGAQCDTLLSNFLCCRLPLPVIARTCFLDLDDRLRCPKPGGAIHLGCEGVLAVVLVPTLASLAARSALHTLAVLVLTPALLCVSYTAALVARRRSRFFVSWSACSVAGAHALFTLRVGERIWFGWWLLATYLQGNALVCAIAARGASTGGGDAPARGSKAPLCADAAPVDAPADATRCKLCAVPSPPQQGSRVTLVRPCCCRCARRVAAYDHHCMWTDACIGRRAVLPGPEATQQHVLTGGVRTAGTTGTGSSAASSPAWPPRCSRRSRRGPSRAPRRSARARQRA